MTEPKEKFCALLKEFSTAMLVTVAEDGCIRSRPMHIAQFNDSGEMWFVTSRPSGKVDEIQSDVRVGVVMQGSRRYVSVSGVAEVEKDAVAVRAVWSEAMRPWFPQGPADPDLVLIHFVPEEAEYWDSSGWRGVKYLFEAARAIIKGDKPHVDDPERHATVNL